MTEEKSLIVGTDLAAVELYTVANINALLKEIEKRANAIALPDTSTDANRKEIIAHAFRATQSKTMIIKGAEKITEDWRKQTKDVNAVKKIADVFLTDLAKKIRKPVTDWEVAEKERVRVAGECLSYMSNTKMVEVGTTAKDIMGRITTLEGFMYPEVLSEEAIEILQEEQENTLATLRDLHNAAVIAEEEKAELDQLRKEKEERELKEKAEAEEKQRLEDEEKEKAQRLAREEQDEKERLANEERIRKEEKEKATREAEEKIAEEKRQREEAERKEREAEERRVANVTHRNKINHEAITSLVSLGIIDEDTSSAVVEAISEDQVDHLSIKY